MGGKHAPGDRRKAEMQTWIEANPGKCGSLKTDGSGERCKQPAGAGTDHVGYGRCKHHMGCTPSGRKGAQQEMAAEAVERFGIPRQVSPQDALMEEVHRSAGVVAYLDTIVRELEEEKLKQHTMDDEGRHWEKESVWVKMYRDERAHLVKVAAEAIRCGIEERQVRVAEAQAVLFAQAIKGILVDLGVDRHPHVNEIVRRHLTAVSAAA